METYSRRTLGKFPDIEKSDLDKQKFGELAETYPPRKVYFAP